MKIRFAQKRPLLDTLTRFWATDGSLSIFSALLLVAIFVLPPLQAPGAGRTFVADALFALLLIAGVRALSERRLTLLLLTPVAAVTVAVYFASWVAPVGRLWVELAGLVSMVLLLLVVLGQTFRSGPITFHQYSGSGRRLLTPRRHLGRRLFPRRVLRPGSFSGPVNAADGARGWLYFSFVTLTTVGYGDILPVHPVARSLAILEAVTGPLYLAILLARLVSLAVAPGTGREPSYTRWRRCPITTARILNREPSRSRPFYSQMRNDFSVTTSLGWA